VLFDLQAVTIADVSAVTNVVSLQMIFVEFSHSFILNFVLQFAVLLVALVIECTGFNSNQKLYKIVFSTDSQKKK
jgi:hypothetical protein